MFPTHHLRSTTATVSCLLAALALSACGGTSGGGSGSAGGSGKPIAVTLSDSGCSPSHLSATAGPVSVEVLPASTGKAGTLQLSDSSGLLLGEAAHVVRPAKGRFSLDLAAGEYALSCQDGGQEEGTLTVSGTAAASKLTARARSLLTEATSAYESYVASEAATLESGTRLLIAALAAGETARSKELLVAVRSHYLSIEPAAGTFAKLAAEIDQSGDTGLIGFHRIEQVLWTKNRTVGTANVSSVLMQDVEALTRRASTLQLQPAQLANNAAALVREMAAGKLEGQEDRYSHADLADLEANLSGARKAVTLLVPALRQLGKAGLARQIEAGFASFAGELATYKHNTPLGFVASNQLMASARRRLAARIEALYEPLARVAAIVSGAP
ncbi:MAG TPA: imelysin family protein [Solirubrobacteraceae bacterium]|jgi:iron uptake system component EfeO